MLPFDEEQQSFNKSPLDEETLLSGQFWGELRVFLAVAKTKSFNRAAEMTNTSQPTVSRQVKRLQDVVGSQLFVSTPRGVKLTQNGEALAQVLSRLDYTLHSLTSDLKAESLEAEGTVRVSITDGLNALFAAPALDAVLRAISENSIAPEEPAQPHQFARKPNRHDDRIWSEHVIGYPVQKARASFTSFPSSPKTISGIADCRPATISNTIFSSSPSIIWRERGSGIAGSKRRARGRIAHYCDNSFAYGMLVKAGHGIGLLGSYTLVEPCFVPLEIGVRISVPLFLLAKTERLHARPVRLVFDWLAGIFGGDNPWFSDEFKLNNPPSEYDAGFRKMFNLQEAGGNGSAR